jgi:hypothetical protein
MAKKHEMEMTEIISDLLQEIEEYAYIRYQETDASEVMEKWAKEMTTVRSYEYAEAIHKAMRRAVRWHEAVPNLPKTQQ